MKTKLTLIGAMAVAFAAFQLAAMPTEEEAKQAEPVVKKMLASERAAFKAGKKTRSEVAAAAMGLADKTDSEAEKLLLMKGACDFYVHAGEFDKAIETLQTMMTKIPDIPYATIVSILEYSLRGVPRNSAKDLCAFLDETKSLLRNTDAAYGKNAQSETNIQKFSRLFPGWEICKGAQGRLGFELAYRGQFNVAVLHPVSQDIPAVVSRTLKLSRKNPCLFLKVSSCDYNGDCDWVLSVRVNGKEVLPKRLINKTPNSEPWEDITVPLFAWRGQEVTVEIVVTANGWYYEFASFKRLEIAEGSGRENLIPEAKETIDGYTWSYRVQNGEATIISEKEGKMSCAVSPNPVGSIVIPSTLGGAKVTSIGRDALAGCQELESVTIPQGVKRIGRGAFFECKKLKSVEIPSSVTGIDWCAFYRCNALASVSIPSDSDLKSLENGAFAECFSLKSIAIPNGVTRIARHAFLGCFNFESLTIPATASSIGGEAFRYCVNLSSVTMLGEKPDTSVPPGDRPHTSDNIFLDCGKLKSIHVPANAKSWAGMKEWLGIPLAFDAEAAESRQEQSRQEQSRYMIVDLDKSGKDAVTYLDDVPNGGWGDEYRTNKIALRKIDPGSFEYMPGKSFKITKPFYIGVFEVTQKQYEMVMKENPSVFKGDMRPVERVSYTEIRGSNKGLGWPKDNLVDDDSYLGKLRERIGLEFDLPTEVQWEYACRAGTTGDFNVDGVEMVKLGKCIDNGGLNDHHVNVGGFIPNAWGLYDMHGNVWEWCLDRGKDGYVAGGNLDWDAELKETDTDPKGLAEGSSRFHRGGSWLHGASGCRSSRRLHCPADSRQYHDLGFRLACPADANESKDPVANVEYKFSYRLENGMAIITGIDPKPVGTVVIPEKIDGHLVTRIEGYNDRSPFWGCDQMTRVVLPAGLELGSFDSGVFISCKSLSSIEVSESNQQLASLDGVLYSKDFSTLCVYPKTRESIKLSPKTKKVKVCAFRGCALKTAKIPEGVEVIDHWNFAECPNLVSVEFPESVTELGCSSFGVSDNMKKIVFNGDAPRTRSAWGQTLFSFAPSNLVVEVRKGTKGWKSPNSTELPERWPVGQHESRPICYIGEARDKSTSGVVKGDEVKLSYEIVDGGVILGHRNGGVRPLRRPGLLGRGKQEERKEEEKYVTIKISSGELVIPDVMDGHPVRAIASDTFSDCKGMTSVTIPDGVTSIGKDAFKGSGIRAVAIPASVTNIGISPFADCQELMSISVDAGNPSYSAIDGQLCTKDGKRLLAGVNGNVAIPTGVKNIERGAFCGFGKLTSVTIPEGVTNVGFCAFCRSGISTLTIPSSVQTIEQGTFWGCGNLKSVTISEGVTDIGSSAFWRCGGLESVTIPSSVKSLAQDAFRDCGALTSVTMLGERPDVDGDIFRGCDKLKSIHVPVNAKSWEGMLTWHGIPIVVDGAGEPKIAVIGVEDLDLAVVKERAENGDAAAMCELGSRYRRGVGVGVDDNESAKWIMKAASNGHERANGLCYAFGYGVAKDAKEAVKWYMKAVDKGDICAMNNIGICYKNGDGVEKNAKEGVKWLLMAADKGLAIAMSNLGGCYSTGEGVEKDAKEAKKWYRMAADKGYAEAIEYLKRIDKQQVQPARMSALQRRRLERQREAERQRIEAERQEEARRREAEWQAEERKLAAEREKQR